MCLLLLPICLLQCFQRLLCCTLRLVSGLQLLGEDAITSSAPTYNTTPVEAVTVLNAESVEDSDHDIFARSNLEVPFQAKKRDGADVAVAVALYADKRSVGHECGECGP